jgi:hypothetical protein
VLHSYVYQIIREKVAVAGTFAEGKFRPARVRWGQRVLTIQTITTEFTQRDGQGQHGHYSVVADGLVCRLRWHINEQQWWLEEIWCE